MKVQQLSLANFRGFEQIDLTFEPTINVIAGVNGVGKSSILQALAVLFSRALPEFTPSTTKPLSFTDEDISFGKPMLETSAIFTVADKQCRMVIQRIFEDDKNGDHFFDFWQTKPEIESLVISEKERESQTLRELPKLLALRTLTCDLEANRL